MKTIDRHVKWGIIGCGDVCEWKSGPAFNKIPDSRLVAVMRRDLAKAKDYAARHGVPGYYDDAAALIHDPDVNAIYIATPPAYHEKYTAEAVQAGKPVYVEKPVALDAASCERMIAVSKGHSARVSVAHYRRALPLFLKVRSLIHGGDIGNVRVVQLRVLQPVSGKIVTKTEDQWRVNPALSGGGLFHDLSPHQLDIICWIFGAPTRFAGASWNQSKIYNAPDVTTLQAVFEKDILLDGLWAFNVHESCADEYCEIIGDRGKLRFAFFRKSTIELTTLDGTAILDMDYPEHIQHPMIGLVAEFFRGNGSNPCSLEDALVTMRMMDATKS